MTSLNAFNKLGNEIKTILKLKTFPLAIKFVKKDEDFKSTALQPKKDFGHRLDLCQGFAMARREGTALFFSTEDHWCFYPPIGIGLCKAPEFFVEGNLEYPARIADLDGAKRVAIRASSFVEPGTYKGVSIAPLENTTFEPDVVIMYCTPDQLRSLLLAMRYKDGSRVTTTFEPGGACVESTLPTLQSGECNVCVPCLGDRSRALAEEDEMIFSIPTEKLDELIIGLRECEEVTMGLPPVKYSMRPESPLPPRYVQVAKMIEQGTAE